jgi:hypothetical protein
MENKTLVKRKCSYCGIEGGKPGGGKDSNGVQIFNIRVFKSKPLEDICTKCLNAVADGEIRG